MGKYEAALIFFSVLGEILKILRNLYIERTLLTDVKNEKAFYRIKSGFVKFVLYIRNYKISKLVFYSRIATYLHAIIFTIMMILHLNTILYFDARWYLLILFAYYFIFSYLWFWIVLYKYGK